MIDVVDGEFFVGVLCGDISLDGGNFIGVPGGDFKICSRIGSYFSWISTITLSIG